MCRLPVTFGGGMTMQNGLGVGAFRATGPERARSAPTTRRRGRSTAAASNDLSIMDTGPRRARAAGFVLIRSASKMPASRRRRRPAAAGLSPTTRRKSTNRRNSPRPRRRRVAPACPSPAALGRRKTGVLPDASWRLAGRGLPLAPCNPAARPVSRFLFSPLIKPDNCLFGACSVPVKSPVRLPAGAPQPAGCEAATL